MNDKYLQFSLEDFILDDAFVNWIKSKKDDLLWNRWLDDNPEASESVIQAKAIISALKFEKESISPDQKARLWGRIEASTTAKVKVISTRSKIVRYITGAAVAASLAFLVFIQFYPRATVIQTDLVAKEMILPGDSKIELFAHTTLRYHEKNWSENRKINLTGEAIFDVTGGASFIVETVHGTVRVLGTKFKVRSIADLFDVVVEHGTVEVAYNHKVKILTAGQSLVANPSTDHGVSLYYSSDLKQNLVFFEFDEQPLHEVFSLLELQYGVTLSPDTDVKALLDKPYTGHYSNQDNIDLVLKSVMWPMHIDYTIEEDIVYLRKSQR